MKRWLVIYGSDHSLYYGVLVESAAVESDMRGCIGTLMLVEEPHDTSCNTVSG